MLWLAAVMRLWYIGTVLIQSTKFVMKCWYSGHYTDCAVPAHPSGKGSVNIRVGRQAMYVRVNVTLKCVRVTIVVVEKQ